MPRRVRPGYHPGMHKTIATCALAALAGASLRAQDQPLPNFRVDLSLGFGNAEHTTDGSNLDGDTDAGFFRLQFEGFSDAGFGGGVRLEGWKSDDDIFTAAGQPLTEATTSILFGHFSWRTGEGDFTMPVRAGLMFHGHVLEETSTGAEATFASFGPQFELAPELFLARGDGVNWSVFAELGLGIAATVVEVDTLPGDFDSSTWMYGFELGTRVYFGHFELGLSYALRGHEMDESDPNGGNIVFGYDAGFDGILLTVGAIF
jgi:hypothetical protein